MRENVTTYVFTIYMCSGEWFISKNRILQSSIRYLIGNVAPKTKWKISIGTCCPSRITHHHHICQAMLPIYKIQVILNLKVYREQEDIRMIKLPGNACLQICWIDRKCILNRGNKKEEKPDNGRIRSFHWKKKLRSDTYNTTNPQTIPHFFHIRTLLVAFHMAISDLDPSGNEENVQKGGRGTAHPQPILADSPPTSAYISFFWGPLSFTDFFPVLPLVCLSMRDLPFAREFFLASLYHCLMFGSLR